MNKTGELETVGDRPWGGEERDRGGRRSKARRRPAMFMDGEVRGEQRKRGGGAWLLQENWRQGKKEMSTVVGVDEHEVSDGGYCGQRKRRCRLA